MSSADLTKHGRTEHGLKNLCLIIKIEVASNHLPIFKSRSLVTTKVSINPSSWLSGNLCMGFRESTGTQSAKKERHGESRNVQCAVMHDAVKSGSVD